MSSAAAISTAVPVLGRARSSTATTGDAWPGGGCSPTFCSMPSGESHTAARANSATVS